MPRCPSCQADFGPTVTVCPTDGTPLPPGLEGQVLGERYRVTRELGEGGMGRVYLAEHVILGKQVAVKVLRQEYSKLPDLVKRFQLEAVAASQIGQENIVDVNDFGKTPDGSFYFVMEYVAGRSLAQLIDGAGPIPYARVLNILLQISKALGAAHGRGIIHRDLKPDNVLVTRKPDTSEHAKVLDFGISKVGEGPTAARITQVGMVVGTPHYMAPEQATGGAVDARVDIYAFGVLAYEMLTAKLPFDGENSLQILIQHQQSLPIPPRERRPDLEIPARLEKLILRCMEKNRGDRPQSMGEIGRELAAIMAELGMTSGPTPLVLAAIPEAARNSKPSMAAQADAKRVPTEILDANSGPGRVPSALEIPASEPRLALVKPAGEETRPERRKPQVRIGDSQPGTGPNFVTDPVLTRAEEQSAQGKNGRWIALGLLAFAVLMGVGWLATRPAETDVLTVETHAAPAQPPKPLVAAAEPAPAPTPALPPVAAPPTKVEPAPAAIEAAPVEPAVAAKSAPAHVARQRVLVTSVPAGAQVTGDKGPLGPTPVQVELGAGEARTVHLAAPGYHDVERTLRAGDRQVSVKLEKVANAAAPPTATPPQSAPPEGEPFGKMNDLKDDPYGH